MYTSRFLNIILFAISGLIFTCCESGKKNPEEKKVELEEFVEEQFEYPIPTAYDVSEMLKEANAHYQPEVPNSPEKVDSYVTQWQKAMNLGVYGADLSYASTFDKQQETISFLSASSKLVEELNISTAFNADLVKRIETNLENKDSLILIVTESFYDTYNYLNSSGEEKTSLLVVAGSVIEGLYITTELIKSSNMDENLLQVLANQKAQVQKLTAIMEEHSADENVAKVLPFLRFINLFYDQLGDDGKISEGQFNDVANSIAEMRKEIVA